MIRSVLATLFFISLSLAAAPIPVYQQGQSLILIQPMDWHGSNTLYVLHNLYQRDSSGIRVTANPCMTVVPVMSPSSVGPQSNLSFSYNIRSHDSSQAFLKFNWRSRDTGSTVDTSWMTGYLWDTVKVNSVMTTSPIVAPAGAVYQRYYRLFNLVAGGEDQMCVDGSGVGSGDTVIIQNPWLRGQ